ncbi:MAG: aminotransferase class V-fold PLP-dependent enzyme [Granulosicoccaceae bacterium]
MAELNTELLNKVRDKFAQIDTCPVQGERVFFENAGGALTLKSAVNTSMQYAAIPDNQGRDNPASHELARVIDKAKADMAEFMNAPGGQFFVGESGTELLFRLISNACLGTAAKGIVLGSTLEHPATRSACARWSKIAQQTHVLIEHDDVTGSITPNAYAKAISKDTVVATILHTSPVTGMGVELAAIAAEVRKVAPDCFIIVDGIQHAAHGSMDLTSYGVDGYVISPYKVFSRHGYGVAWISDRLAALPHDSLIDGPDFMWELGTRDTGSYATLSDVVEYFDWLGSELDPNGDRQARFNAAGQAIAAHEKSLTDAMINGAGNVIGLASIKGMNIIGGLDNPAREGLIGFWIEGVDSTDIVKHLNNNGIRTHLRKADYYSSNILTPLGQANCVRVSMCHYNTTEEVAKFLHVMQHFA